MRASSEMERTIGRALAREPRWQHDVGMATVAPRAASDRSELLERDGLLESLGIAFETAAAGAGRLVLLAGEAGVGKTSLARRFCDDLPGSAVVLWGGCDPLATPQPLGPFTEIADEYEPFSDVVAEDGGAYEIASTLLRVGHRRGPVVLVLEDVHWADEATLDVLRVLGRRVGNASVLALATYRDDGLDRSHPLRVVLGDVATASTVQRLRVEPLSPEGVSRLADGAGMDPGALYALTSGNPFYVTEVLAAGGVGIPGTVRDIVLARVLQLSPGAAAVVEAASIAPPSLDANLLLAVCGEAVDAVDECLASGVLHVVDGAVAFRHELARATVEEALSPARRVALHRAVLTALAHADRGSLNLARLSYHAEAAGDGDAVLRSAPAAAEQAARVGAYREAAAQYARALRFAGALTDGQRAELLEGRSRACYMADDQVEAIAAIQEAVACRERAGDGSKQARALSELCRYLGCRGFVSQAENAVREATRLVEGAPPGREVACVYAGRAWLTGGARGHEAIDACLELADIAIELAERFDDPETALDALVTRGTAELRRDVDVGRATLERAAALGREHGIHEQVARALNNAGGLAAAQHEHDVANSYLTAALDYSVEHDLDLWRINVLALAARSLLDQGRWTDAAERATQLLRDPRDSPWPHHEALLVLALVRGRRGDPGAKEAVEEARAVGVPAEEVDAIVDLAAADAEIAWLEGRLDDVEQVTAGVLAGALERGAHDAANRLLCWRRLAGLPVPAPLEASDPYTLALAGDWHAAAARWADLGCPYEHAMALAHSDAEDDMRRALAELQGLGARPGATVVTRRLRELGARDVPTGPRPSTRRNPAGLTARELDVLPLLVEGLRNAEIADRLFVSPRTVDHHVSSILRKLAVETRGQTAAAAERLGLLDDR